MEYKEMEQNMKITNVTLTKQYKCGLPSFSNITTSVEMTWEIGEGEAFNFDEGWDTINRQLQLQGTGTDQSWMHVDDLKESTKVVIKIPKTTSGVIER